MSRWEKPGVTSPADTGTKKQRSRICLTSKILPRCTRLATRGWAGKSGTSRIVCNVSGDRIGPHDQIRSEWRYLESFFRDALQHDIRDMSRLVSQLLELAQAEALVIEDPQTTRLADVGREVVSTLEDLARTKGQELVFEDH